MKCAISTACKGSLWLQYVEQGPAGMKISACLQKLRAFLRLTRRGEGVNRVGKEDITQIASSWTAR